MRFLIEDSIKSAPISFMLFFGALKLPLFGACGRLSLKTSCNSLLNRHFSLLAY
ncbi:hypothetical protein KUC_0003 [Vreelandella boliviensis LC1]|uniref:Uncharacterized protein n=1 Tax=Vreelandella boliviensis LC1 TaxID=1072583 RepID=A0A7U9GG72_9GAMM|nr:hypothetical protein KUC_0003 [Halomonas boliviensis LC1]